MNWSNTYRTKLQQRISLLDLCAKDLEAREIAKELCRRNISFFVNNFCWTFDPRLDRRPNHFPFILYPFQEEYLDWRTKRFEEREDGLTEKSRDMGVTWLNMAWDLYHWLFDDSFHALIGSRKEDLVDKSDNPDSLFWKIDYMVKKLPKWLLPNGFCLGENRKNMLLKNPQNDNTLVGESANSDFSRQGRYSVIDFDEFAFWQFAGSAWTSAAEAARTRFATSTPEGKDNKFADLRFNSAIPVITLHWKLHPLKDEAWYEKEKTRMTPKELAQEVDIDYEVSGGELWLPWYRKMKAEIEVEDIITPKEVWSLFASIDFHPRNAASCNFYGIDYDGVIYSFREYYQSNSTVKGMSEWIKQQPEFKKVSFISADPQLWAKDQETADGNVISRADQFCENGVVLIPGAKGHDLDAREITRDLIFAGKLKISPACPKQRWEFGEACRWDDYSELLGQSKGLKEQLKDKDNHAWDNFKYLILFRPKAPKRPKDEHWFMEERVKQLQKVGKYAKADWYNGD